MKQGKPQGWILGVWGVTALVFIGLIWFVFTQVPVAQAHVGAQGQDSAQQPQAHGPARAVPGRRHAERVTHLRTRPLEPGRKPQAQLSGAFCPVPGNGPVAKLAFEPNFCYTITHRSGCRLHLHW